MSNYKLTSPIDVYSSSANAQINMYNTGGTFAVQLNAPSLTTNIDFTLPSANGTNGHLLKKTGATSIAWAASPTIALVGTSIPTQVSFNTGNIPTTNVVVTSSNNAVAYFMYNGSTLGGPPTDFSIVYTLASPDTGRVQIIDITNSSNVIADTGTFSTVATNGIYTVTTFTNVPTSQAVFQVFASGSGAGLTLKYINFS